MTRIVAALAALLWGMPAAAASVTVAGLADGDNGLSYGIDARFSPTKSWSLGAGVGHSESSANGTDFSGTSLRVSTDFYLDAFTAGASVQHWSDSRNLKSTSTTGQFGWMWGSGWWVSALVDDRRMTVDYTATLLGQTREAHVDFKGTGFGVDVSWLGQDWNFGARWLDYDYGRSAERVRGAMTAGNTVNFPRLQLLLDSIVTRAAGAPDQQMAVTLGRQFRKGSLQGEWATQRDALTHARVNSVSLVLGGDAGAKWRIDTTLGISDGDAGSAVFGGLSLTLRSR